MQIVPIASHEWRKFLLTAAMITFTVYIYSILRLAKDSMLITELGAELISTVKLWGVLPSAVLFMLIYARLTDWFKNSTLYHGINFFFISFFIVFTWVLYPNVNTIHPDLSGWTEKIPYLRYFFIMLSSWSYSLFYIFAELWGSVMLSLLFWQFANHITSIPEAKRFYPLFGFVGQAGLIASGLLIDNFSDNSIDGSWHNTLSSITISVIISGLGLSLCLWYLSNYVVGNDVVNGVSIEGKKSSKPKMGFIQGLRYIFSSKYIGLITLLVLCYGVSINLVEGVWKKSMSIEYPLQNDYADAMGTVQMYTGIATAVAMLCSAYLMRIVKWRTAALLTPIMILITGFAFFILIIFDTALAPYIAMIGMSAVMMAVQFGMLQQVLSKSTKYAFFDPTKEMAYIPLDDELKKKGKAAADVIGGRLGKSGGSIIQWVLLSFIPGSTLVSLAPSLFIIFIIVMVIWLSAIFILSKEFEALSERH